MRYASTSIKVITVYKVHIFYRTAWSSNKSRWQHGGISLLVMWIKCRYRNGAEATTSRLLVKLNMMISPEQTTVKSQVYRQINKKWFDSPHESDYTHILWAMCECVKDLDRYFVACWLSPVQISLTRYIDLVYLLLWKHTQNSVLQIHIFISIGEDILLLAIYKFILVIPVGFTTFPNKNKRWSQLCLAVLCVCRASDHKIQVSIQCLR